MRALLTGLMFLIITLPRAAFGQALPSPSSLPGVNDQGTFMLYVDGRSLGTEKFEIRSSAGQVEARAQINLRVEQEGKVLDVQAFPDLVLDPRLNPLSYTWSQKGSQSSQLSVDFHSPPAHVRYKTISGEEETRDFDLPADVLVLDDNVLHHYQLVVDRYRMTPGGRQTFHAFIPQEALPGILTVEDRGKEMVAVDGPPAPLDHLLVETEMAKINLWVDGQQRLQRISVPEVHLEAYRKKSP
jgi:hypothetical protein